MRRLFLLVALTSITTPSLGNVIERESHEWYEVHQSAGTPLLSAINSASPVREGGKVFHAYTAWDVHWNFSWNTSSSSSCEITSVTTNLSVKMTLPRLSASTPEGAAEFDRYFPALLRHEQGHRAIALDAANQVDQSITSLPPMTNCQVLEREANRIGMEVLESAKRRDIDYDAATKHGCTQGACLAR